MDSSVWAWLDWDSERVIHRGRRTRIVVNGELASLDRRVAERVLAHTLGLVEADVVVTLEQLSVIVPSRVLAESETYRALIDEAVAEACLLSRRG